MLDDLGREAEALVQDGARHCPKAVACDLGFRVIAQSLQRGIDRRATHRFSAIAARKDVARRRIQQSR